MLDNPAIESCYNQELQQSFALATIKSHLNTHGGPASKIDLKHQATKMVFGVLIAKNQDILRRHVGSYMENHNSMERKVVSKFNNHMDNEEVKQTTLGHKIPLFLEAQYLVTLRLRD